MQSRIWVYLWIGIDLITAVAGLLESVFQPPVQGSIISADGRVFYADLPACTAHNAGIFINDIHP